MALDPGQLSAILSQAEVPSGWVATLVDQKGIILARSQDYEAFAGEPMPAAPPAPGIAEAVADTPAGAQPLRAHAWSKLSGWLISVEVPAAVIAAPMRHTWLILAASGAGLLALSMALALWLGHRLAWPIQAAAQRATLLGDGDIVPPLATALREANDLNRALAAASVALRERTDALRESEARLTANVEQRKKTEEHIRFIMREVTHRAKRRLYGLAGLAPLRDEVAPPRRPEPGRGRGRPPVLPPEQASPPPPLPAPALTPIARREFDTSDLEAAMAFVDEAIRRARRNLASLRSGRGAGQDPDVPSRQ